MVLEPTGIRSLLIRAWRERWSDIQWGIHIKTVLPRYISGDIYQLSDCLLQQALLGSLPNNLILSYLHHSLASQIVSFGGVIESISKYDGLNKPYCIQALLNILQSMMRNVNCKGKPEDCLMLSTSLVAGVKWLFLVMNVTIEKLVELQTAPEHSTNLNLARSVLQEILSNPFLICLLHIGCKEDPSVWSDCVQKACQLEAEISGSASSVVSNKDGLLSTISEIKQMKPLTSIQETAVYDPNKVSFCHSISSLIYLEVMEHTTRDAKIITRQLLLLQKFKGITLSELYYEVIRTCFMGISAPEFKKLQEFMWIGFTYIKLPTIIHSIHTSHYGENAGFSTELQVAFQKIALMTALLDYADCRMKCNCLEFLFKELIPKVPQQNQTSQMPPSLDLLSERDAQTILATRMQESNVMRLFKDTDTQGSPLSTPDLILRAQPTVIGIMKTIINKNMDSVMPVLSLLISGKSRELLLISATSSGSLHIYAQKFVKLNESSMEPTPGETPKMAATRGIVFDISFLLLCHIAQIYGIQVVVSESCNTFVEKWILNNIPELGKIKMVINPSEVSDYNAIEDLLRQINCMDMETKYVQNNFAEISRLSAFAMRELIVTANQGQVIKQVVRDLLDKFCYHLCALPVCITAWLCSYLQEADGEEAAFAMDLIQYMQNIHTRDESNAVETFSDRAYLMSEIIGHMVDIIKKPTTTSSGSNPLNSPVFLAEVVGEVWTDVKSSDGILTHKALKLSGDLIRLGGVKWFVANFVKAAMENVFENELFRSIDVVYGLFHLDIYSCTIDHIMHTMPNYICGPLSADLMCEPRPFALGRLTAMLIVECWVTIQPDSIPSSTSEASSAPSNQATPLSCSRARLERGQKRSYSQREMEELIGNLLTSDFRVKISSLPVDVEVKFFLYAVVSLFSLMNRVICTAVVSPVTHLIVFFLKELIAFPHSSSLLNLLRPSLLTNLLPLLSQPLTFEYPQLLALSAPDCLQENVTPLPLDAFVNNLKKKKEVRQSAAKLLCVKRNIELFNL